MSSSKNTPAESHEESKASSKKQITQVDKGVQSVSDDWSDKTVELEKQIVVGIGASAGGLEALQIMVSNLPTDSGMCFVLAQHLSPSYKSMMVDLLAKDATIQVVAAKNNEVMQPNVFYICPPSYNIEISHDDRILLTQAGENPHIPRPSVDILFESIALAKGESAVGIVLSGTGTDGSRGIRAIKGEGGFGISQDPNTAKYDGMPNSAINSGNVDLILSPEEIGPELKNLSRFPRQRPIGFETNLSREAYFDVLRILKRRFKIDFRLYKESTIMRRIERRMTALKLTKVKLYLKYLQDNPNEAELLFNDMLIGVTAFFRDARAFNSLQDQLSHYFSSKENNVFRVWVPGCSTGEEAYSIAIVLFEVLGKNIEKYKIQIFATDIDKRAVEFARAGTYPESALHNLPEKIRRKYFTVDGDQFQIIKPIKSTVIFSEHDVTVDPPFLRLDLLSCRNLLIYFNLELQRQVLPIFHYALNPKGMMFLGQSESIGMFQEQFKILSKSGKIFEANFLGKKTPPERHNRIDRIADFVVADMPSENESNKRSLSSKKAVESLSDIVTKHLKEMVLPFSILINESMDIVYTQGENPILIRPEGIPTNNIYQNMHPSLTIDLRSALHQVHSGQNIAKTAFQKIEMGDDYMWARLILIDVHHIPGMGGLFLIFCQLENRLDLPLTTDSDNENDMLFKEQERQLLKTKEQLQTVIEELETSNEEMQSMNEELQSSNEELQSSNEELETTNEELQSTNEELQTAYAELRLAYEDKAEQQKELETLRQNLARTNTLLLEAEDVGRTGSFRWLVQKETMEWSRGIFRLLGVNEERFQPSFEALKGLVITEDRDTFEESIERLLQNRLHEGFTFRVQGANKQEVWLYFEAVASFNNLKVVEEVMGTLTDITSKITQEQTLERTQQKMNRILDATLNGVYEFDFKTGKNRFVNKAYENILGYKLEDLNALNAEEFRALFHPDDLEEVLLHIQNVKDSHEGEALSIHYRFKHKTTGEYIWIYSNDTLYEVDEATGAPLAMLGTFFAVDKKAKQLEYIDKP